MKIAIAIGVAIVMPLGFLVLTGVIVNHVLSKRRRLQTPSSPTQGDRTGQAPALALQH
jgi:hypothetical protein